MLKHVTIAMDAMGGDKCPSIPVSAALSVVKKHVNVSFLIFVNKDLLNEEMNKDLQDEICATKNIHLIHTDKVLSSNEKPSVSLRNRHGTSMFLAIEAVKEGRADAAISAGNAGALMAMSRIELGTIKGVIRPGMCALIPSLAGPVCAIDVGANVDCSPDQLLQFAIMGAAFCRARSGKMNPKVGILNIGEEAVKGNDLARRSYELIKEKEIGGDFVGFVEPDGILRGDVDVFVADGFVGNVAIKSMEGIAHIMKEKLKEVARVGILPAFGMALVQSALKQTMAQFDPNNANGAMLIGLNGIVIKSHGNANECGFASAILSTMSIVRSEINRIIGEGFFATGIFSNNGNSSDSEEIKS